MDILAMGAELLSKQLGVNIDVDTIKSALGGLLGDGSGRVDLAGLAAKIAGSGDLASVVGSWLGDGANQAISADTLTSILGSGNIADFASKLGTSSTNAADGLAQVLPQMLDKASSGGALLDSLGGAEGLMGFAKKLF